MKRVPKLLVMAACSLALSTSLLPADTQAAANSKVRVKAFAKLPDWSGVWEQFKFGPGGELLSEADLRALQQLANNKPPYKPEWQAKLQTSLEQRAKQPLTWCEFGDLGMLAAMTFAPLFFQALLTPEEVTLMFYPSGVRHIDTDGRKHPPADELFTTAMGDSIGRWEGDTLVVDTVGSSNYLIVSGDYAIAPLSDSAQITERIRLIAPNTLENRITVNDPVALTNPWEFAVQYHRVAGMRHVIPLECKDDRPAR